MKKILLSVCVLMMHTLAHATNGLENIIVEKFYVSDAADAAGSSGALPVGSVTYSIFADMLPGYNFQATYGVPGHALVVQSSTSFFNNEDYGSTTPTISTTNIRKNSALLDSYFSVGGAANGRMGVLKTEDSNGSPGNTNGILQNNDPSTGGPVNIGTTTSLSASDGMITGTPVDVTFVGITTGELSAIDATSQAGNYFTTTNGSVAALGGAVGPTASNRVLIGQFTTDGIFSFELNIQIGTPTGGVQNYVAFNPVGNEIQLASLSYSSKPKLDMNVLLEGFCLNTNSAEPMDNFGVGGCLFASGLSLNYSDVDSIRIDLVDSAAYANTGDVVASTVGSGTGVLQTNGTMTAYFPVAVAGSSYYLKVVHRNHVETWSARRVALGNIAKYNFTDSYTKAYEFEGNPFHAMKQIAPGKWALYSGDINQDSFTDIFDIAGLTTDMESETPYGYLAADLNGDGFVDIFDIPALTTNLDLAIYSQHP